MTLDIKEVSRRLEALGNQTRLEVYRQLVRAVPEGLSVGTLQERTDVAASTLSHHLHRLIAVGLVTQERQGTTLICHAESAAMNATLAFLQDQCCADTDPACR